MELDADILIADDEPAIRNGCRRVLAACQARLEIAGTGAEAMEKLGARDFDVAIIDLIMPSFGGMEVLDRLAEADNPVVPIVITAHASIETAVEAIKRGAFDYLPKPFVPLELITRVERALRWRRLRQEADRRLTELDTEKTRLRAIVGSLADGVLISNLQGEAVLCNRAACQALGIDECHGEPRPVDSVVQDEVLRSLIRQAMETVGSEEEGVEGPALTTQLTQGDQVYMARVVPIPGAQGLPLGAATVLRDVTQIMQLERAKSQFMSMVAHELKTPLAAVQGYLQAILVAQSTSPEKVRDIITRSGERVEGMTQLVRDLLDLSRADMLPTRQVQELQLAEVVSEIVEHQQHFAEATGVTLRVAIPKELPALKMDREELGRILTNLVSNAIKYNLPGGEVVVSAEADAAGMHLSVQDTGLGIPAAALPRLGQEFFRVNLPDRRGTVGTGLGLSLVKRTVQSYGGELEVQSELGAGSTFTVHLPPAVSSGPVETG